MAASAKNQSRKQSVALTWPGCVIMGSQIWLNRMAALNSEIELHPLVILALSIHTLYRTSPTSPSNQLRLLIISSSVCVFPVSYVTQPATTFSAVVVTNVRTRKQVAVTSILCRLFIFLLFDYLFA